MRMERTGARGKPMNATGQARRSDALYYSSNDGVNRRWLCDKVASLEAENAKLQEQGKRLFDKTLELETENAELRELVDDVHAALRADKTGMFHKLILASMEDDMRELEVDE